jgi:2',3'-cyclic-nucleotide 2'-phosphodiesterase (5'-nucleotidase family)
MVENGKITSEKYELLEVSPASIKPDKEISAMITALEAPFKADIERVIGYSKTPLYRYFVVENTIDTMILDALSWKSGQEIVLSNGFRFCPPRSNA